MVSQERRKLPLERREQSPQPPTPHVTDAHLSERATKLLAKLFGLTLVIGAANEIPQAEAATTAQLEQAFHYQTPFAQELEATNPVELAIYYDVVEHFPYDAMLSRLAERTGLTAEQLQQQLDLQIVMPYSPDLYSQIKASSLLDDEVTDLTSLSEETLLAFTTGSDEVIAVNLKGIKTEAANILIEYHLPLEQYDQVFRCLVYKILVHEFVHAVAERDELSQKGEVLRLLVEGFTEAIALELIEQDDTLKDLLVGMPGVFYPAGEIQAARFMLLSLGEQVVTRDLIKGDYPSLIKSFEDHYGRDTWRQLLFNEAWFNNDVSYGIPSIAPLYTLLQLSYHQDGPKIVEEMNQRWPENKIIPIVTQDNCIGVALLEQGADARAETEIMGLVEVQVDDTTTLTYHIGAYSPLYLLPTKSYSPEPHWFVADTIQAPRWGASDRRTIKLIEEKVNQYREVVQQQD